MVREPHSPDARAALRTRAAVAVAAGLLVAVYGGLISLVSARYVGGRGAAWTWPAAAASIFALLGLAAEREGWPPRRVLATVVVAGCLAAQLGLAALLAEEGDTSWLAMGAGAVLLNLVAVAVIDRRGGDRGRLWLAVLLWVGVSLVLGGAGLLAAYLDTHAIITIG